MKSTKTDNLEVKNNEENVTAEAAETKAAAAADTSSEEKEKKKEKKKTFTVDELLAQSERIELYDEYGKKKKIKVKVKSGKLKKRESRNGYLFTAPYIIGILVFFIYPLIMSVVYTFNNVYYHNVYGKQMEFVGFDLYQRVFKKETTLIVDLGTMAVKLVMAVPLIVVFDPFE